MLVKVVQVEVIELIILKALVEFALEQTKGFLTLSGMELKALLVFIIEQLKGFLTALSDIEPEALVAYTEAVVFATDVVELLGISISFVLDGEVSKLMSKGDHGLTMLCSLLVKLNVGGPAVLT